MQPFRLDLEELFPPGQQGIVPGASGGQGSLDGRGFYALIQTVGRDCGIMRVFCDYFSHFYQ
ncbi:hypothetical protein ANT2_3634 [plant metagenome]|uniref:Uncharacterized protein n=1 Tax=plant metagenome TaxID=1297885 RepID=A0A484QZ43_9ZZZZ